MLNKEEFIKKVENNNEGKWFQYKNIYKETSLVKMKKKIVNHVVIIDSVWLSVKVPESMGFESYKFDEFDIINEQFVIYSADAYNFGSPDDYGENSIYNDKGELVEEKVKNEVLSYADKDFITTDELDRKWDDLKNNNLSEYEVLK